MIMKTVTIKILAGLLCTLSFLAAMASCNSNRPTIFDKNTESSSSTEETTAGEVNETRRFDYFGATIAEYVNVPGNFYKSLKVTLSKNYTVTDKDVESAIDNQLFNAKKPQNGGERTTNVAMRRGDTAYIFYKGLIDGKEFEGGSNMTDETPYALSLGSGRFIPGFEDELIGVVPKDTSMEQLHEINIKFPDDYGNDEYAGKDVTFLVYVVYSVQYEIPELTAELVTDTFKFKTEEEDVVGAYKKYVKDVLQKNNDETKKNEIISLIWEQLTEKCETLKYPEGEVEYFYDSEMETFKYYYQQYQYMGYKFDGLDDFARQYMGLAKDADWQAALKKDCELRVDMFLICHGIAAAEGIEVTEEDYKSQLAYYVDYYSSEGYTAEYIEKMMGEFNLKEAALNSLVIEKLVFENTTVDEPAAE